MRAGKAIHSAASTTRAPAIGQKAFAQQVRPPPPGHVQQHARRPSQTGSYRSGCRPRKLAARIPGAAALKRAAVSANCAISHRAASREMVPIRLQSLLHASTPHSLLEKITSGSRRVAEGSATGPISTGANHQGRRSSTWAPGPSLERAGFATDLAPGSQQWGGQPVGCRTRAMGSGLQL